MTYKKQKELSFKKKPACPPSYPVSMISKWNIDNIKTVFLHF